MPKKKATRARAGHEPNRIEHASATLETEEHPDYIACVNWLAIDGPKEFFKTRVAEAMSWGLEVDDIHRTLAEALPDVSLETTAKHLLDVHGLERERWPNLADFKTIMLEDRRTALKERERMQATSTPNGRNVTPGQKSDKGSDNRKKRSAVPSKHVVEVCRAIKKARAEGVKLTKEVAIEQYVSDNPNVKRSTLRRDMSEWPALWKPPHKSDNARGL